MKSKKSFCQPVTLQQDGRYKITYKNMWATSYESDNKNYKKSTMYKWLKNNCIGEWGIDEYLFEKSNGEFLYISMYNKTDAVLFSLCHNLPLPAEYEYVGPEYVTLD